MPDDLEIAADGGAFTLRLRVSPSARKARIIGVHGGALKLSVVEPPEGGRANEGVIELLAEAAGIAPGAIQIVSGHTGRDKRVRILGFPGSAAELKLRLTPTKGQ